MFLLTNVTMIGQEPPVMSYVFLEPSRTRHAFVMKDIGETRVHWNVRVEHPILATNAANVTL
jgi:hypothetical protein